MSEQERDAMIAAAKADKDGWWNDANDERLPDERVADFALAQTADLREKLRVAREALERTHKVMCDAVRTGHYASACGAVSAITEVSLAVLDGAKEKEQ